MNASCHGGGVSQTAADVEVLDLSWCLLPLSALVRYNVILLPS